MIQPDWFLRMLTVPVLVASLAASAQPDLTFFGISDTHYGNTGTAYEAARKSLPGQLNRLPGQKYPASLGGAIIDAPRGILIPGDLVDRAAEPDHWKQYAEAYGVDREGEVAFPVYDALGNHDDPGLAAGETLRRAYIERNRARAASPHLKVVAMDSQGYNYSWDWDGVHFVNLNLYSGNVHYDRSVIVAGHSPYRSLAFLEKDLRQHVGRSGRPVFVLQHYAFDGSSLGGTRPWWLPADAEATFEALKDYNVIGLHHGHSHGKKHYKWKGWDVFDNGTAMNGDILIFRIKGTRMTVCNRVGESMGNILFEKTISLGSRSTGLPPEASSAGRLRVVVDGEGTVHEGPGGFENAVVLDMAGKKVRRLPISGEYLIWNRADEAGRRVPAGLYVLRFIGKGMARPVRIVVGP